MTTPSPRTRRLWIGLAILLVLGGVYSCIESRVWRDGAGPSAREGGATAPTLRVRGEAPQLEDTPAARGEAEPRDGEVWFEALTLEEEIADSEPRIVVGRVLDEHGVPIAGVWVQLAFDDDQPPGEDWQGYALETGDDGVFLFEGLPERIFRVIASRTVPRRRDWRRGRPQTDSELAWVERRVVEGVAAGRRDVRVRMQARPVAPEEWTARVRVFGPDGKPVRRWSYTECSHGSLWSSIDGWVEPEPGEAGEVVFSGQPPFGLIVHSVVDEAYEPLPVAPGYVHGLVPDAGEYVVHLERAASIRGRVVLPPGMETANVVVRYAVLTDGRAEDPTLVTETTPPGAWRDDMTGTDGAGRFELEGLPPGRVRLIPLPPGASLDGAPDDLGTTVDVGDRDVRLRLAPHAPIRGTIDFGAITGAKEVGVQLHVRRWVDGRDTVVWSKHLFEHDLTKSGGAFETIGLPTDETYDLEVWAQGMLPGPQSSWAGWPLATRLIRQVTPGGAAVFVVLQKLPSIRGRVVTAAGAPARSGVVLHALRADVHPLVRAVHLGRDATLAGLGGDLGALIRGEGEPYPAEPRTLPPPGAGPYETQTVDGGMFTFPALPAGAYLLWTRGPDGEARLVDPPVIAGGGVVQLELAAGRSITGRVRDARGGDVDGFIVEARDADAPGRVVASSVVRSDGYFALGGMPDGAWLLTASNARDAADGRAAAYARVAAGSRRIALDLAPAGVIAGRVVDTQGKVVHGARIAVTSSLERRVTRAGRDGTFRLGGLVGSEFSVQVTLPDGRSHEQILVGAAEDIRLVVP